MNFLDKINTNDELSFLEGYGFISNETCGYGCCNGWFNSFYSGNKSYFNRVVVWKEDNKYFAKNHTEYECGGLVNEVEYCFEFRGFGYLRDDIMKLINSVLPNDLD